MQKKAFVSVAVLALAALACRTTFAPPDLGELYTRAARHHDAQRNPVIVIPGVLGSKLTDPVSGRPVWGAFGGSAADPRDPEGARLVALPMQLGRSLAELTDEIHPDGVLDRIKVKLMGLPFQLQAYLRILLTLGAGGYHDETFHSAGVDYGADHYTCFQFDYDWRRDIVENARRLHEFILEKRAYVARETRQRFGTEDPEIRFDVVAHSMGGLLLRYYLRYGAADLPASGEVVPDWAGSPFVDRAVLVAPPNSGALDSLQVLVEGRKFGPLTPRYQPALLGTFPALYEMLPRVRHGAVVAGGESVDVLDPETWERFGWGLLAADQDEELAKLLPEVDDPAERRRIARDHLEKSLERARRFQEALDVPATPPASTRLYLFAGDAVATASKVEVEPSTGALKVVDTAPGDGSVLRSSALGDERVGQTWQPQLASPVHWENVTFLFTDHLGMTHHPVFNDNILYLLLEAPGEALRR